MSFYNVIVVGLFVGVFGCCMALGATRCVFPKGELNGHCVECPVDTLYEYVESYSYQIVGPEFWRHAIKKDESYHRCVKFCSPKNPYIGSNRKCASRCAGNTVQRGNREYCRDEKLNNGFCNVNDCSVQEYKCYFIQCFTECPAFTVIYNNSCVIECFDDKPFIVNGECVEQCPEGYVLDNGVCQMTCSSGRYLFNKTCVDKCPRNKEYVDDGVCVSECPLPKLYQIKVCVNSCSESFALDGRVCRIKCPSGHFKHQQKCVKTCPESTLEENQTCVKTCSSGFFQVDYQCVLTCPQDYYVNESSKTCVKMCDGVKYYKNSNVLCLNDCPEQTVEVNSTCMSHCPIRQPFLHGRSCFSRCPDLYRFVEKKIGLDNLLTYICVEKCTKYSYSISNLCVDACSLGEVLYKEICQEQCPNSDPYKVHFPANSEDELDISMSLNVTSPINAFVVCAKECPSNFVRDNGECYVNCPSAKRNMIFNSSCLQHCPEKYPFIIIEDDKNMCTNHCVKLRFQQTCLDKCPNSHSAIHEGECIRCTELGMYEQNQKCVNECDFVRFENRCYNICPQNATYIYNKTCVKACPSNANTVDEQYREGYNHLVCTNKCPSDKFISGNNCVSSCPDSKRLPFNGTCMACLEVGKYDDGSRCVDECPDLHHEFSCVSNYCPNDLAIFNKTCVADCPVTAPIKIGIIWNFQSPYKCIESCEKGRFAYKNRCVYSCENAHHFIFDNSCVEKCPQDAQFISKYKDYYGVKEYCVSQCKETEFIFDFTCVEKCPDGYYSNRQRCIQGCPTDNPYKYGKRCVHSCQSLRVGMNCYAHCPHRTYQYNKTCVQNCPLIKPYNYNDKCVEVCPFFLIKKTCYEQCPSGLMGYNSKCLLQCPDEAKYRYKWRCFNKCPNNTIFISMTSSCSDSCPHGKLKYQQNCYDQCPMQAPYNFKGECVESCDGYLYGLECYKQCPPRLFVYKAKCIPKCPEKASFVHSRNCVTSCPFVHDDHHNCMKECPQNTYPDGKRCMNGCPPSLPFKDYIYKSKCIEKCESSELATEDNRCILSSQCSGFIYYSWCFQKCPPNIYILRSGDKNYCKSLIPVYIMIGILSFFVIIAISFGIIVFYHCKKLRRGVNKNRAQSGDNGDPTEEVNLLQMEETCS